MNWGIWGKEGKKGQNTSVKALMFFRRVCVPAVPLSFTTPAKAGEEPLARVHGRGQQAHGSKPYQIINCQICKASGKRRCGQFETSVWLLFKIKFIIKTQMKADSLPLSPGQRLAGMHEDHWVGTNHQWDSLDHGLSSTEVWQPNGSSWNQSQAKQFFFFFF